MLIAVSYFHTPLLLWTLMLAAIPSLELTRITVARRRAILSVRPEDQLGVSLGRQGD